MSEVLEMPTECLSAPVYGNIQIITSFYHRLDVAFIKHFFSIELQYGLPLRTESSNKNCMLYSKRLCRNNEWFADRFTLISFTVSVK